jgi:hypothetical protein
VLSQNLPNLKARRLDGIPSGNDDAILNLVTKCAKLECIVLDYCFGITMECVAIIWNGLNSLKFLGFAGLNGTLTRPLIKKQGVLATLRRMLYILCSNVDCTFVCMIYFLIFLMEGFICKRQRLI